MFNMNSGYNGYRMSNRAVQAYEDGEMPLSKWTKQRIIDAVVEYDHFTEEELRKFSKAVLKDYFLKYSSWHHTSQYCNETYFYEVDEEKAENGNMSDLETTASLIKEQKKEEKKENKMEAQKAEVKYLTWGGTRSHPKAEENVGYAIIVGKWAYFSDGSKKSINANGFKVLKEFGRAPRGTADEFKLIMKNLPKAVKGKL